MYKNCGALLRNIYMEGQDILGEIETLSGFLGPDIAKMVLYDKVNVGFSLRALGSVNTKPDGTIEVLTPIKPITYDLVSNPSHSKARVLEFLPESVSNFDDYDYGAVINESAGDYDYEILRLDGINLTGGEVPERGFLDEILKNNFTKFTKHMNFRF